MIAYSAAAVIFVSVVEWLVILVPLYVKAGMFNCYVFQLLSG